MAAYAFLVLWFVVVWGWIWHSALIGYDAMFVNFSNQVELCVFCSWPLWKLVPIEVVGYLHVGFQLWRHGLITPV